MSQLQKAPMSLLSALELKISGDNPQKFGAELVPGLEVSDNYLLDRVLPLGNTTTAITPATSVFGTVVMPSTQRWRLRALSAVVTVAAGDVAIDKQVLVGVQDPGGFVSPFKTAESSLSLLSLYASVYLERPFWLPPGWSIYAFGALATAPAANWDLVIRGTYERILE